MTVIDKRGKIFSSWEKAKSGRGVYVFLKWFLFFCSLLFGFILYIRRLVYRCGIKRKTQLRVRVISIGNITLGGTGKTPLVEYAVRRIKEGSKKAAVLSRGYGGSDEVKLFSKRNKDVSILIGKNRARIGEEAIDKSGAEIIVLDDGFQHWPLERDLDIITLDSTWPIWKDRLLPAGTLRERVSSLRRAHVFVLTRVENCDSPEIKFWQEYLKSINPQAPVFLSRHKPKGFINRKGEHFPLSFINGKEIVSFSGIAKPEAFEETLRNLGGKIVFSFRYPDHHYYRAEDLEEIKKASQDGPVITTEKDLVRIENGQLDDRLLALVVEIEFLKDGDRFLEKVLG